jgi:cathepsin L
LLAPVDPCGELTAFENLGTIEQNKFQLFYQVGIVGHGKEGNDEFWIVQNSWGGTWGEKGFIRMSKNKNNQCGINDVVSYPVV